MLDLINSLEYEYNSFKIGTKPSIALKVQTGVHRSEIKKQVISAVKEISKKHNTRYSDIAVLFPFRHITYHKYFFLYWLKEGLDEEGIPSSMIINETDGNYTRTRQGDISGVVISTIESSLGLDFKAVILAGLYPYDYANVDGSVRSEIKTWTSLKNMPEEQQTAVQSQMRSIYTACSRARDILYVISDLKPGSPMEEIIKKQPEKISTNMLSAHNSVVKESINKDTTTKKSVCSISKEKKEVLLQVVTNNVTIKAVSQENKKEITIIVDIAKYPNQIKIIGKKVGDIITLKNDKSTYIITKIISYEQQTTVVINDENTEKSNSRPGERKAKLPLKQFFESKGFFVIDYRKTGGYLWIIGEKETLKPYVDEAIKLYGVTGEYGYSKHSNNKHAWWTESQK